MAGVARRREAGLCHSRGRMMAKKCAASCGVCTTVCEDKDQNCRAWFEAGKCDAYPGEMQVKCPQSCGICSQLEKFYKKKKSLKDEV